MSRLIPQQARRTRISAAIALGLFSAQVGAQRVQELKNLDISDGFTLSGIAENDQSGHSVSSAGDFNGDGVADLIIGEPYAAPGGVGFAGQSYIVFGQRSGFAQSLRLEDLDGTNGLTIESNVGLDQAGISVSGAGDINADGLDDVVIGAPGNLGPGRAYVVFGAERGLPGRLSLASLNGENGFRIDGIGAEDGAGRAVSGAGDFNGDGVDDLVIGAPYADVDDGEAYVVFGNENGFAGVLDLSTLDGSNGITIVAEADGGRLGRAVSGAGDVNDDGLADVVVGAFTAGPDGIGKAYVVFGSDQGFASFNLSALNGNNGFEMLGANLFDNAGRAVGAGGDVNADGIDDVLVGASFADPGSAGQAGEGYVVFGSDQTFAASINLGNLSGTDGFAFRGTDVNDRVAQAVAGAGDVNGDGIDDILIGASQETVGGLERVGSTYVVFGRTTFPSVLVVEDLSGSDGLILPGIDELDQSGFAVSGAGDINDDGLPDLLIGARLANASGQPGAGESYVVYGNAAPMALSDGTLLGEVLEDQSDPAGHRLDFTLAAAYLDMEAFGGVAVIDDQSSAGEGAWQYAAEGSSWTALPSTLSDTSALVLGPTAQLRFVPEANFFGEPGSLMVRLWDGRWREPGENVDITTAIGALGGFSDSENLVVAALAVTPVNDEPSFVATDPPTVNEDPGGVTVSAWSAFDPGPGESGQFALAYQVENISNPGLFSVLPTIGTLGNLVYNPAPDVSGTSTFDVRVVDNGGIANGGVDVSGFQTFTININPVNDAPNLIAENPPPVAEGSGAQSVSNWATLVAGAPDESGQQLTIAVSEIENPDLFAVVPAVDQSGELTYTPAQGVSGTSTFTVIASDNGGTENGGVDRSQPQHFLITVQAELLFADSFEG
ncbi:MAG: Ig-like domain-containing protein [Pseudomonadota bacterium]